MFTLFKPKMLLKEFKCKPQIGHLPFQVKYFVLLMSLNVLFFVAVTLPFKGFVDKNS